MRDIFAKAEKDKFEYEYWLRITDHAVERWMGRSVNAEKLKKLLDHFIEELFDLGEEKGESVMQIKNEKLSFVVKAIYKKNGDLLVIVKTMGDFLMRPRKGQIVLAI